MCPRPPPPQLLPSTTLPSVAKTQSLLTNNPGDPFRAKPGPRVTFRRNQSHVELFALKNQRLNGGLSASTGVRAKPSPRLISCLADSDSQTERPHAFIPKISHLGTSFAHFT